MHPNRYLVNRSHHFYSKYSTTRVSNPHNGCHSNVWLGTMATFQVLPAMHIQVSPELVELKRVCCVCVCVLSVCEASHVSFNQCSKLLKYAQVMIEKVNNGKVITFYRTLTRLSTEMNHIPRFTSLSATRQKMSMRHGKAFVVPLSSGSSAWNFVPLLAPGMEIQWPVVKPWCPADVVPGQWTSGSVS